MLKGELDYAHPGRFAFFNCGVSGDRVVDLYARMKKDAINLCPDYVSILVVANDVWHELNDRNGVDHQKI